MWKQVVSFAQQKPLESATWKAYLSLIGGTVSSHVIKWYFYEAREDKSPLEAPRADIL